MTATLAWTENLPDDWQLRAFKFVGDYSTSNVDKVPSELEEPVRLCNYTDVYKNDFIHPGLVLMQSTATFDEIAKFRLFVSDVVITKDSEAWDDIAVPALVIEDADDLVCGYHLAILRADAKVLDGRFLFRCVQSKLIRQYLELESKGVTRFGLGQDAIGRLPLPIPPLPTQRRIADYLDRETAQIDALIEAKEQMLTLLQEKRAAQISHMVTKGLDPNAEMKDSGLEWLGEIPAHWELLRIKTIAYVGNGSTPNRENADYWEGGTFPWLNSSVVNQEIVEEAPRFITETALAECHLPIIEPPAVLVGITGQGKTRGKSSVLNFEATINQHIAYIKARDERLDAFYLSYLLESAYEYLRSESEGTGSTKGAITCEQIAEFRISLPPLDEQQVIVATIRVTQQQYSGIEDDLKKSLSLLRERRSALITAAVTGQLAEVLE